MKVFTTGDVSKICQVSMSTVNKWFDAGQLKGFRVPGSRHRRIPQHDLVRFLHEHGMPCDGFELEEAPRVLIVSPEGGLSESLESELKDSGQLTTLMVRSSFEAGIQAEAFQPDCVMVDSAIGADEGHRICKHLRCNRELADVVLIALLSDAERDREKLTLVDDVFESPFDPALLAERVRSLVSASSAA